MLAINVYYGSLPERSREPETPYFRFLATPKHWRYMRHWVYKRGFKSGSIDISVSLHAVKSLLKAFLRAQLLPTLLIITATL